MTDLRSALNQVLTVLRDVDVPLDVRVNMAHDIAESNLRAAQSDPNIQELVTRADSCLSLLWQRYVPSDRKDGSLSLAVDRTIGDLRRAGAGD